LLKIKRSWERTAVRGHVNFADKMLQGKKLSSLLRCLIALRLSKSSFLCVCVRNQVKVRDFVHFGT